MRRIICGLQDAACLMWFILRGVDGVRAAEVVVSL